jgi:hypothetical protein
MVITVLACHRRLPRHRHCSYRPCQSPFHCSPLLSLSPSHSLSTSPSAHRAPLSPLPLPCRPCPLRCPPPSSPSPLPLPLLLLPFSSPSSLIVVTIAHVGTVTIAIAIALVANARPPPLLPLPSLLSPLPSLLHATLIANATALATLALPVARHPLRCHHRPCRPCNLHCCPHHRAHALVIPCCLPSWPCGR